MKMYLMPLCHHQTLFVDTDMPLNANIFILLFIILSFCLYSIFPLHPSFAHHPLYLMPKPNCLHSLQILEINFLLIFGQYSKTGP